MSPIFWTIVAVVFIALEVIIPGLVTVWFGLAGIVMIFLSPFIEDMATEFYIFAAISFLLLILTKPIIKKYFYKDGKDVDKLGSRIIGRETKIVKILDEGIYEVILDEKAWRCISSEPLEINDRVTVTSVTGNKLILEKKINQKL